MATVSTTAHASFLTLDSFPKLDIHKPTNARAGHRNVFKRLPTASYRPFLSQKRTSTSIVAMATAQLQEVLPPSLDASSEPPALFDGTTRLYIAYICPYAQRTWIARNFKGLKDKIKLVPIDLQNRPTWYKEKVYSVNKVPSLEHNNEVRGESLDLIKYIDSNFEGPALLPNDTSKREFAEELLSYTDTFNKVMFGSLLKDDFESEIGATLNHLENALSKFNDGDFFLGQFSLVDIAYAPFIERSHLLLLELKNYDIAAGRPKLAKFIEEINKIEAYAQTRQDPKALVENFKRRHPAK